MTTQTIAIDKDEIANKAKQEQNKDIDQTMQIPIVEQQNSSHQKSESMRSQLKKIQI